MVFLGRKIKTPQRDDDNAASARGHILWIYGCTRARITSRAAYWKSSQTGGGGGTKKRDGLAARAAGLICFLNMENYSHYSCLLSRRALHSLSWILQDIASAAAGLPFIFLIGEDMPSNGPLVFLLDVTCTASI